MIFSYQSDKFNKPRTNDNILNKTKRYQLRFYELKMKTQDEINNIYDVLISPNNLVDVICDRCEENNRPITKMYIKKSVDPNKSTYAETDPDLNLICPLCAYEVRIIDTRSKFQIESTVPLVNYQNNDQSGTIKQVNDIVFLSSRQNEFLNKGLDSSLKNIINYQKNVSNNPKLAKEINKRAKERIGILSDMKNQNGIKDVLSVESTGTQLISASEVDL